VIDSDLRACAQVKVNVTGVKPLTQYYYTFSLPGESPDQPVASSQIGRFRTFPDADATNQPEQVKIGLYSCSNFGWGYFNAFGLAASPPLDVDVRASHHHCITNSLSSIIEQRFSCRSCTDFQPRRVCCTSLIILLSSNQHD
jgi:hypothetical protein